ncbi:MULTISPECIES: branched-chain amino acid ABC transporter permease [Azospirillum]|uniref:Branched-chain amino acid ABC transporter permease n=2 Tax=Azospirillum TaxID=191 RepID=A0A4D8QTN7_AZOBR|nr:MULTISPECIES: branched-chain amino acid ABC transporter permease [Azospirillum]MBK3800874.1 branched-chain amino acid ABC transporter permease [Azospirillum argentinense]MDW7557654.1 branched-chain amino acid ABC transporter permease [Azospirillum brasilense]MDW7597328.1 branched-chain amino acid ABC transporter permease [Azospirillum brasilense]MDW7632501.1 branched-chain amino acid ABC transporter permease [Azospirillum brasilense]MDX5950207.1 branched-chain amino acid ABC transporter per
MANALLIQVLNGLVYGGLLFIVSVGLVLIFGLRRVVNFAHGSLFMIGAYVGFSIATVAGFWAGVLGAAVVLAVAGVLLDVSVFRPLRRQDPIATVLVTFGLLLILEDLAHSVWGKDTHTLPLPEMLAGSVDILGQPFPAYRLMVIAVAAAVGVGLALWLRFSRVGLFVRASSIDPVTTAVQGVNTDRVSALVVAVGTGLAGLSGTIAAPLLALSPSMGGSILIESFIVVVVGGLGSFSGALIAALAIGQIHNLGIIYVPWAATMVPFLLMVAVLVWRPTGFAGSHV